MHGIFHDLNMIYILCFALLYGLLYYDLFNLRFMKRYKLLVLHLEKVNDYCFYALWNITDIWNIMECDLWEWFELDSFHGFIWFMKRGLTFWAPMFWYDSLRYVSGTYLVGYGTYLVGYHMAHPHTTGIMSMAIGHSWWRGRRYDILYSPSFTAESSVGQLH